MGKKRDKLDDVRFKCDACGEVFNAAPSQVIDLPEDDWHPWGYSAPCPHCGDDAEQDPRERSLLKAWASATGPRSEEGKARSASNLDGHPTPEAAQRTRFNSLKHGLNARTATYWPARPGSYPECENCELLFNGCTTSQACSKKTELFLRHHVAFATGDTRVLTELRADLHANLQAIVNQMVMSVIAKGAVLESPEWYYDREGMFHLAQYRHEESGELVQLKKLEIHPAIKQIGELVSRLGLDLNSQGMTPKVQDDSDVVRGYLSEKEASAGQLLEFQQRQTKALEGLGELIDAARKRVAKDPILLEHQAGEGSDG